MTMTGSVAIWVPDGDITAAETTAAREAFERAAREHVSSVVISIDDGRVVTFTRTVLRLPIFIESAEANEAQELARILSERADRRRAN